jgi:hypothetical protein
VFGFPCLRWCFSLANHKLHLYGTHCLGWVIKHSWYISSKSHCTYRWVHWTWVLHLQAHWQLIVSCSYM